MNLIDWGLYALAIIFVLNLEISYAAKGCKNHDKASSEFKLSILCFLFSVGSGLLDRSYLQPLGLIFLLTSGSFRSLEFTSSCSQIF